LGSAHAAAHWVQTLPPALAGQPSIFDSSRQRVLVLTSDRIWASSNDVVPTWSTIFEGTRLGTFFFYDPSLDRIWSWTSSLLPSYPGALYSMDLSALSPAWTAETFTGVPPRSANSVSTGFDPVRHRAVIFGGTRSGLETNAVSFLSLDSTPAWSTSVDRRNGSEREARCGRGLRSDSGSHAVPGWRRAGVLELQRRDVGAFSRRHPDVEAAQTEDLAARSAPGSSAALRRGA